MHIDDPARIASAWLTAFSAAVADGGTTRLFTGDAWWRDLLSFTGDFRSMNGAALDATLQAAPAVGAGEVVIDPDAPPPHVLPDSDEVQAFFRFRTNAGTGRGVVRLRVDDVGGSRATTLLTSLQALNPHTRPEPPPSDGDDEVVDAVVVGAGHSGLGLAAYLQSMDCRTVVIDRNARVGDNWRSRYDSLVLHDPVWANHLPFLPFPASWPVFTPKEMMGDWLENYAKQLDLDVRTGCEIAEASYDGQAWSIQITSANGTTRIRARELVIATGLSGNEPIIPSFPGEESFGGELIHSSRYHTRADRSGTRAVVIGTGNSGHDVAQDLVQSGASVTLVQRGPTYVVGCDTVLETLQRPAYGPGGVPTEIADLAGASFPQMAPSTIAMLQGAVQVMKEQDRSIHDGLRMRGFALTDGPNATGASHLFLTRNGGYYIDVGASEMIIDGRIGIVSGRTISRLTPTGVEFDDGTTLDADTIVLSTGFSGIRETARRILGDDAVAACTPVWDLDAEGELQSVWRKSGQPGLWFTGGNLTMARIYNRFLALQVTASAHGRPLA